jgi:formylglycine-generating enzyme required for sulfatase activity
MMKTLWLTVILLLSSLALTRAAPAAESRCFRITSSIDTRITAIHADGTIEWTNAMTGVACTVQTAVEYLHATNWVDYLQVPVTSPTMNWRLFDLAPPAGMVLIPAGSYVRGDTFAEGDSGERPTNSIYISAFYMDKWEVTKGLWDTVTNWARANGYDFSNQDQGKGTNHPVHPVNWYDCVKWCNARSQMEGLTPVYYADAAQTVIYKTGAINISNACVKWTTNGYRLPTESEWEKAARGGLSGKRFPWGDTISHSQANYYSYWSGGAPAYPYDVNAYEGYHPTYATGGGPYTSPVGVFPPNGYLLFDMAGNVFEWCWDWHDGGWYGNAGSLINDNRGPSSGSNRVIRGGGWDGSAYYARCARRYNGVTPDPEINGIGFRCVRLPGP